MKLPHDKVAYEHPAKGKNHCGECEHFIPASHCHIVADPIRPEDWCNHFEKQKTRSGKLVSLKSMRGSYG